ncbi:hypothetical protein IQ266_08595 [filamentous cyanobacterium LEGE 11480]|uniref:Uncharacterized protein n=1 Tax=Romeriopsis navalis LEGE 11480 TaxID=2777977 RepID=A0A928VPN8_9CYAN|nr:hypothetical protein [Romeriopsis navalis]MBE9029784.1 hypothetical protein [Romeriopsis navalis LEGE 11480]
MQPSFKTLIILTLISVALLAPFAFSASYFPLLRDQAFDFHEFLRGDLYKQVTGYISLAFVLVEMVLTLRKRGRRLRPVKVSVPGTVKFWRRLHVFFGVVLLGVILIHTGGAVGQNFNGIFLWVFFGVTLSALVGVVAETGVLESAQQRFSLVPIGSDGAFSKALTGIPKSKLIQGMRGLWLSTHILFVSAFFILLGFHIFLVYNFQ